MSDEVPWPPPPKDPGQWGPEPGTATWSRLDKDDDAAPPPKEGDGWSPYGGAPAAPVAPGAAAPAASGAPSAPDPSSWTPFAGPPGPPKEPGPLPDGLAGRPAADPAPVGERATGDEPLPWGGRRDAAPPPGSQAPSASPAVPAADPAPSPGAGPFDTGAPLVWGAAAPDAAASSDGSTPSGGPPTAPGSPWGAGPAAGGSSLPPPPPPPGGPSWAGDAPTAPPTAWGQPGPAAPSAWGQGPGGPAGWTPPPPPGAWGAPPPRKVKRNPASVVVSVVLVLALVAGAAYLVINSRKSDYPKHWDSRVQAIADFDEQARGLTYDHPVKVNFLSPAEYRKITAGDDSSPDEPTADQKESAANGESELRAMGLVSGKVDLNQAGRELSDTGTLAFYSPETKQVYVRGTEMTPGVRVTLAHELTHVLQDQHFDLSRVGDLEGDASSALRAVVEGDADRVEEKYKATLSKADKAAYDKEEKAAADDGKAKLDEKKVPEVLQTLLGAPYAFGGRLVDLLLAKDGEAAINKAIQDPPKTSEEVFDARVYLDRDEPGSHAAAVPVKVKAPKGAKVLDRDTVGSITWYLFLARQLDPHEALKAVDGWGGDHYVLYRTAQKKVCMDLAFEGDTPEDTAQMLGAMQAWAAKVPPLGATARSEGKLARLTTCDPGVDATVGGATTDDALYLPLVRTDAYTALIKTGTDEQASCFAQGLVDKVSVDQLKGSYLDSTAGQMLLAQLRQTCG